MRSRSLTRSPHLFADGFHVGLLPPDVFLVRDWFEMCRIYAQRVMARMVKLQTFRDWANHFFVDKTISPFDLGLSSFRVMDSDNAAMPISGARAQPIPATRRWVDFPFRARLCMRTVIRHIPLRLANYLSISLDTLRGNRRLLSAPAHAQARWIGQLNVHSAVSIGPTQFGPTFPAANMWPNSPIGMNAIVKCGPGKGPIALHTRQIVESFSHVVMIPQMQKG
jgi:hypothetical protein